MSVIPNAKCLRCSLTLFHHGDIDTHTHTSFLLGEQQEHPGIVLAALLTAR